MTVNQKRQGALRQIALAKEARSKQTLLPLQNAERLIVEAIGLLKIEHRTIGSDPPPCEKCGSQYHGTHECKAPEDYTTELRHCREADC